MIMRYDADHQWINDLRSIFREGKIASPRGMPVHEILAYQSVVSMENPIIYNEARKLGYRFMAAEAAWILSGRDDVASITDYSKAIKEFSDNGETFFGAYGPKIVGQIQYAIQTLMKDLDSRQAVINIWRENPPPSKDIPCTLSLQWVIRGNEIHCIASMRSSDLWLGHPYDIFNFSAASFFILLHLRDKYPGIKLGNLYLTCGSKHIYQRNLEGVSEVLEQVETRGLSIATKKPAFIEENYDDPSSFIDYLWGCADSPRGALLLTD